MMIVRIVLGIVVAVVIIAAFKPTTIERFTTATSKPASAPAAERPPRPYQASQPSPASNSRSVPLRSDGRGHFETDARIDGRSISMLVDTGASSIALRESAAARLGIFPAPRDYTARIHTANGVGKAAPVRLSRVELGDITVRDVQAFVVPDEALSVNLLGMSFLSRVKWSHDRGRLVLEQ